MAIGLAQHDFGRSSRRADPQQLVRDHTGNPDLALGAKGEAIGKLALAEFMHDLLRPEPRARVDREAAEPPAIALLLQILTNEPASPPFGRQHVVGQCGSGDSDYRCLPLLREWNSDAARAANDTSSVIWMGREGPATPYGLPRHEP